MYIEGTYAKLILNPRLVGIQAGSSWSQSQQWISSLGLIDKKESLICRTSHLILSFKVLQNLDTHAEQEMVNYKACAPDFQSPCFTYTFIFTLQPVLQNPYGGFSEFSLIDNINSMNVSNQLWIY